MDFSHLFSVQKYLQFCGKNLYFLTCELKYIFLKGDKGKVENLKVCLLSWLLMFKILDRLVVWKLPLKYHFCFGMQKFFSFSHFASVAPTQVFIFVLLPLWIEIYTLRGCSITRHRDVYCVVCCSVVWCGFYFFLLITQPTTVVLWFGLLTT